MSKEEKSVQRNEGKKGRGSRNKRRRPNYDRVNCDSSPKNDQAKKEGEGKGLEYNDPAWRQYDKLLADQVNSFSFNRIAGTEFRLHSHIPKVSVNSGNTHLASGRVIELNPSAGYALTPKDPINQIALSTYTKISMKNSRTIQYAPQDITMCMLALNSLLATAASVTRALGMAAVANTMNFNYPKTFISNGLGIDFADLQKHLATYRTRYNLLATTAKAISFPSNFKAFDATIALFSKAFLDHSSDMAQFIVLRPNSYWKLDEQVSEKGTTLVSTNFDYSGGSGTITLASMLDILEQQVDALLSSSTLNFLYADVLKYITDGGGELFTMPGVPVDYNIIPEFSDELRIQVENMVVLGQPLEQTGVTLYTNRNDVVAMPEYNAIRYQPAFKLRGKLKSYDLKPLCDQILNFHTDRPTVDDKTTATRFSTCVYQSSGTYANIDAFVFTAYTSDWYVASAYDVVADSNGGLSTVQLGYPENGSVSAAIWSQFAHPMLSVYGTVEVPPEGSTLTITPTIFGELDKWCVVERDVLKMVIDLSIMSLFSLR